ncbi:PilZ domain-containing protein [Sphingobium sp. CAP-1]|uniref:PilZ domain-containing protein n=1 Tax=Sphingobium sp. CAP-1 TaxID=2676077 RepID=UPI0018AD23B7|nr:PilZ domain-containing protein [Sphingobium sp. CAP-1]
MQTNIAAKLYPSQRSADRIVVNRSSTMRDRAGAPIDVVIEDISGAGCRIRSAEAVGVDDDIRIGIAGIGIRSARVIWNEGDAFGCAFDAPLSAAELATTLEAVTLLHGAFDKPDIAAPAQDNRPANELGPRSKLLIIIGAAAIAWLPFLAAAKLIRALI